MDEQLKEIKKDGEWYALVPKQHLKILLEQAERVEGHVKIKGKLAEKLHAERAENERYREVFKKIISVKNDEEFNPYAYMVLEIIEWAEEALESESE